MRYQRNLQIQLQQQYRRLYKSDYRSYAKQAPYFRDFIARKPALLALIDSFKHLLNDFDPVQWVEENFSDRDHGWPPTEEGRASVVSCT